MKRLLIAALLALFTAGSIATAQVTINPSGNQILKNEIDTSAKIAAIVGDETGGGALVFADSPVFTTPNIGTATGTVSGNAGTATALAADPANCSTGQAAGGVTAAGAAEGCIDPIVSTEIDTSSELATILTDETGSGAAVFGTTPTITFGNTGLTVQDTNASHVLTIKPGSDLTGAKTLTLVTGDADRTVTLTGDASVEGTNTGDQTSVSGNAGTATALAANGANCSAGQYPLGVDASGAVESCTAAASAGAMTLLVATSGTDTTETATNVATVAISGLTALDTIKVFYNVDSITQQTAAITLYNNTDSVVVINASQNAVVAAGAGVIGDATIRQSQAANTVVHATVFATLFSATNRLDGNAATFTTAWTGSWTLALRHGGVTSGGTLRWSWAVYKIAGQ